MEGLKIKKEFLDQPVSFNGSGLPPKFRKDLHVLAKLAIESGDTNLLNMFETIPTADQIKEYEGELYLKDNPEPETVGSTTSAPGGNGSDQDQKETEDKSKSKDDKDDKKSTSGGNNSSRK